MPRMNKFEYRRLVSCYVGFMSVRVFLPINARDAEAVFASHVSKALAGGHDPGTIIAAAKSFVDEAADARAANHGVPIKRHPHASELLRRCDEIALGTPRYLLEYVNFDDAIPD